jgi:hypothetical protein
VSGFPIGRFSIPSSPFASGGVLGFSLHLPSVDSPPTRHPLDGSASGVTWIVRDNAPLQLRLPRYATLYILSLPPFCRWSQADSISEGSQFPENDA